MEPGGQPVKLEVKPEPSYCPQLSGNALMQINRSILKASPTESQRWTWGNRHRGRSLLPVAQAMCGLSHSRPVPYSEPTIGALLGHASGTVTGRYTHVLDAVLIAAADRVAQTVQDYITGEHTEGHQESKLAAAAA
jgi:hypothetical protein